MTAAEFAAVSRQAQGLPAVVTDPAVLATVADLLLTAPTDRKAGEAA